MRRFRYRVAVLTHGGAVPLEETLDSFYEMVTPEPHDWLMLHDGPEEFGPIPLGFNGYAGSWPEQVGFCEATRRLWKAASLGKEHEFGGRGSAFYLPVPGPEYVFWLEHDFVFTRPLDLEAVARVLDADPMLAQMALMRDAVNAEEKAAGGLYESRPGEYEEDALGEHEFLRHRSYFTTNPSLMRTAFMQDEPWPDYDEQCEGRFGLDLVAAGYSFGVWGNGEPWVEHIGERTGVGY